MNSTDITVEPIEASDSEYERYLSSLSESHDSTEALPEYFVSQAAPLSLTLR